MKLEEDDGLFEKLPDALIVLDSETHSLLAVNERFCDLVGCERDALLGRSVVELQSPSHSRSRPPPFPHSFDETGVAERFEWHLKTAQGEPICVEVHPAQATYRGEPAILWSIRRRDSTPVEQPTTLGREQLIRPELFETFFRDLPVHLYVKDREGRHVWTSAYLYGEFTDDLDEVIGKTDPELVDLGVVEAEAAQRAYEDDMRIIETGDPVLNKEERNDALGRWFLTSKVPWRDEKGNVWGLIGVSRDITARKTYSRKLEEYRRRLEGAMFAANLAWWEMDVESGEVIFHRQKTRMLGYRHDDFTHYEDFTDLVHPEDHERAMQAMRNHLEGDASRYEVEYRIRAEDGEYRWFRDIGGVTERDEQGSPLKVTGVVIDVTDRKEDEKRIHRQKDELALLNRLVRHDIKNNVAIITGWLQAIREDVPGDVVSQIDRTLEASEQIAKLTQEVSSLVDAVEGEPDLDDYSIRNVLADCISRARNSFGHAIIAVDGSLTSARVLGNPMLPSVFDNLLRNAIQHNDEDVPEVRIAVEDLGDTVVVHVSDNGPGIPPETRDSIFHRGEKGLDSDGTGIGLYLVATLVDAFGGTVWVTDNDPTGAVFHVELRKAIGET